MRELKADLEICEKATPGEWATTYGSEFVVQDKYDKDDCRQGICKLLHKPKINEDAQFIASAREGWPEAIERAIKAEETLESLLDDYTMILLNVPGAATADGIVDYIERIRIANAALREENEELKKALGLIIDDMGEDSCPYEYDYVDKPECENCPHDHEIHVDTERDVRCWKEYYLAKAGEDL